MEMVRMTTETIEGEFGMKSINYPDGKDHEQVFFSPHTLC